MAELIVQTLDLKEDPRLMEFYRQAHAPGNIWPEIPAGIRAVGVERMDIFIEGTRLVMLMQMADGIDRDEAMARLATLPRQAEWEDYVGRAQACAPGSTSGGKWRPMAQIFTLPEICAEECDRILAQASDNDHK